MKMYTLNDFIDEKSLPFYIEKTILTEDLEPHYHDYLELVIIIGGKANHIIDREKHSISSGDVYVFNDNTVHGFTEVKNLEICNIRYDMDKIMLQGTSIRQMAGFQALFVLEPIYRKEYGFKARLKLNMKSLDNLLDILNFMNREFMEKKEGYESMIKAYFVQLILLLSREYNNSDVMKSTSLYQLAELTSFIEKHFSDSMTIKYMADKLGFSERHFTRVFTHIYGTSPIDYIIRLRLQHACKLLRDKETKIMEVSICCGFTDSNYFTRIFKKYYGVTPSQFRKLMYND